METFSITAKHFHIELTNCHAIFAFTNLYFNFKCFAGMFLVPDFNILFTKEILFFVKERLVRFLLVK